MYSRQNRGSLTKCHIPDWRLRSRGTRTHLPLIALSEVEEDGAHMSIMVKSNMHRTTAISDTVMVETNSALCPHQRGRNKIIHPVSWGSNGAHTSSGRLALSTGLVEPGAVTFHQSTSVSWSPGVDGG